MEINAILARSGAPGIGMAYADTNGLWAKSAGTREQDSPVADNTIFHACSMSKMVTAMCVLRLVEDGELSLEGDVRDYLRSYRIPDSPLLERAVTVGDLLAHRAGICDAEGSFEPLAQGEAPPTTLELLRGDTPYNPRPVTVSSPPGSSFSYSDAGYCLIAQMIMDMTGQTVGQLARRFIWRPLGIVRSFFWPSGRPDELPEGVRVCDCASGHDSAGAPVEGRRAHYPNPEGAGLWTTPAGMALLVRDLMASYSGCGGKVLTQKSAKRMLSPYGEEPYAGLGVFLGEHGGEPCFTSQGWGVGMQCKLRAYPKSGRCAVVMVNYDPGAEQDESVVGEALDYICRHGLPH